MDFSKRYNREEFVKFLQNDFLPEEDFITEATKVEIQQKTKYIKAITRLGTCPSLKLAVYEARHTSTNDARVGLSKEIFRFMAGKRVYRALVAFVPKGNDANYRLSLISIDLVENKNGNTERTYSNPRRFSYYLGENTAIRTPKDYLIKKKRVKNIEDLIERFHIEQVNKTFFAEYKAQYEKFCKFLCENSEMQKSFKQFSENSGKAIRDYVKKMLGRIVFLYFVQRKGWLNGDLFYMSHLFSSATDDIKADFLDRVLEPMFFGLLNTDYDKRQANAQANGWDLSLIPGYENIPYLNGGLFEQDETDKCRSVFPSDYFKELFEFFDTYNFTVDENAPNDADVGIDPEMLGIIFENLLEDNKDKGAFYTPKEIVSYMCRESLIAYLNTNTDIGEEKLRQFVESPEDAITDISEDNNHKLLSALRTVRICDPAIGSGAFPMGLLNELLHCREALEDSLGRAELKKDIIQNNIYGVDIEKGAVDIARLRFWLSLVVDETQPQPLPNLDYKIMCGNSLLHRFALDAPFQQVFKDYNQKNGTNYTLDDYRQWVYNYTNISDHTQKDAFHKKIEEIKQAFKTELNNKEKGKIAKVRGTIANLKMEDLFGEKKKEAEKKIKVLQKELKALEQQRTEIESNKIYEQAFEWRFEFPALLDEDGKFVGFDIVIGNPPYGVSITGYYRNTIVKYLGNVPDYEIYYFFIKVAYPLMKEGGLLSYIIPNTYLFNTYAKNFRIDILNHWNVIEILDCTKFPIFESATVRNTINIWQKKVSGHNLLGYRNTANVTSFSTLIAKPKEYIEKKDLLKLNQNWGLAFYLSPMFIRIVNKIMKSPSFIQDAFDVSQGYIPYRKSDLIKTYGKEQGENIVKKRLWHSSYKIDETYLQEIYGRDINRYSYHSTGEFVKYGKHLACFVDLRFFDSDRILVREITNPHIIACYVSELYVNDPQLISIIKKENKSSLLLLWAILNSKLATFYHFNHSPKATKGAFPKILVQDIKTFPLPNISDENKIIIENLADKIIKIKRDNPHANIKEYESQINNLVYHLYGLTYDEVLIVDPETPITREEYKK